MTDLGSLDPDFRDMVNKRAAGRPKDLLDIAELEKGRGHGKPTK